MMSSRQSNHFGGQIHATNIVPAQPVTPVDSSDEDTHLFSYKITKEPIGLVGLRNMGLTCYMNAALQALSNSVPLCHFLRDCNSFLYKESKPCSILRHFHKLINDLWSSNAPSSIAPSSLYHTFRALFPLFRPMSQQDSQEFLRYFMDQLHEELKEPYLNIQHDQTETVNEESSESEENISSCGEVSSSRNSSDAYETCDSNFTDKSNQSLLNRHKVKRKKKYNLRFSSSFGNELENGGSATNMTFSNFESHQLNNGDGSCNESTSGLGSSKPSVASSYGSKSTFSQNFQHESSRNCGPPASKKRRKNVQYRSIVSDCFDGVLVSSVQCLTCNRTSSNHETFQDLSLPIPSPDQLTYLHQHPPVSTKMIQYHSSHQNSSVFMAKNACDVTSEGWMLSWVWSMWGWLRSWVWGPNVSLLNCLSAFFSADELKGDNMYYCEKCGKLRNGVKYSKVIKLPEILIVHLKRFRHDFMYSSKMGQYVSFPMNDLDLSPFLHKNSTSEVHNYDLYSVICHHGAVGSGHYTAYCQNFSNKKWYEFDDQYVSQVSTDTVANCEAYVLLYKKSSVETDSRQQRTVDLMQMSAREPSLLQFYVSKQWINKFNTFSEPGPIDNSDFLCRHGGVQPDKAAYIADLAMSFSQSVWEYLYEVFKGGPACTSLYECITCKKEQEDLVQRQKYEHDSFLMLHKQFQNVERDGVVYFISLKWFRFWEAFVSRRQSEPPGPLDNSSICTNKNGQIALKPGSDFAHISEDTWNFFYSIYGGGPELYLRYGPKPVVDQRPRCNSESKSSSGASLQQSKLIQPLTSLQQSTLQNRQNSLSEDDLLYNHASMRQNAVLSDNQRSLSATEVSSTIFQTVESQKNSSVKNSSDEL